jgi:hypothetical protein
MDPTDCKAMGAQLKHSFNHFVNASNMLVVTCKAGKRSDGLPDWVWEQEGYEFQNFMPSCFDPTFCSDDPPVPVYQNIMYEIPAKGSLRFQDGESVTYVCENKGRRKQGFFL